MKHDHSPVGTFDWTAADTPAGATVSAVAAVSDTVPTDLPPLHRSVDADGLNALLTRMRARETPGRVEFEYCDHRMVLAADGEGHVYETDGNT